MDERLATVIEAQRLFQETFFAKTASRAAVRPASGGRRTAVDDGLGDVRVAIADARARRIDSEKRQQDKVRELESRLAERRASQTERHPDVLALGLALDRLRTEPAEVTVTRAEEHRLIADYQARGGSIARMNDLSLPRAVQPDPVVVAQEMPLTPPKDVEDDATTYARSLFKGAMENYQDVTERLRNVEIELATAEVSFGYRYTVTEPPRLPKKPDSPNVVLIIVGALLAGLMGGAVRAVFLELQALSLLSPSRLMAHVAGTPAESDRS
jgi:hypothetical protein